MAIYRDNLAGLQARVDHLEAEIARHEARLASADVLRRFVKRDRLEKIVAHREATQQAGDDLMRKVELLERYREAQAHFIEHLQELDRRNVEPISAKAAFSPLSHPAGPAALGDVLINERQALAKLLRFRATEVEIEDGGTEDETYQQAVTWQLHVQARFRHEGIPMMMRAECGMHAVGFPRKGVHYRCPVAPALDELWVRKQGLMHTIWYKPVRKLEEIELGEAQFDRKFLISGYEETAQRALNDTVRETLLLLRGEDPRVSLSIAGGIACLDVPFLSAEQSLVLAIPILTHLHGLRGGRSLLDGD